MKKITLISILTLFILSVFTASILADFYVVPTKIKEWAPVEKTGAEDISVYTEVAGEDILLQKGVAWPDPRFIDNGDGTVTDHLTGLMWMQDADCMGPITGFDSDGTPNDGKVTWQHALDFIDAVNAGTYDCGCTGNGIYSDWRLSNIKELLSLQ